MCAWQNADVDTDRPNVITVASVDSRITVKYRAAHYVVLEIGYESRYNQYDIDIEKAEPLVPRTRRHVVAERMNLKGEVLTALDEAAVRGLVPELREQGVESVAVGFLHSYANPDHEIRVREILEDGLPGVSITLSSEVCPEVREY